MPPNYACSRCSISIGSFVNSGHWSSFTTDCPGVPAPFDQGSVNFGGLNMPRAEYSSPPPNDMSGFAEDPISTLVPFLDLIQAPRLEGDYCQSFGLTPLGETLIQEMMRRGMIVEIDHLPQRSYLRAIEMLEAADYPAAATHGSTCTRAAGLSFSPRSRAFRSSGADSASAKGAPPNSWGLMPSKMWIIVVLPTKTAS